MKAMKRIVLLIILLSIINSLQGQDSQGGKVYGKVRMAGSGEPFENVTVALYSLPDSSGTLGTATDLNGDFEFEGLPDNDYILVPSFVGY